MYIYYISIYGYIYKPIEFFYHHCLFCTGTFFMALFEWLIVAGLWSTQKRKEGILDENAD
jgi:hypothetical protein